MSRKHTKAVTKQKRPHHHRAAPQDVAQQHHILVAWVIVMVYQLWMTLTHFISNADKTLKKKRPSKKHARSEKTTQPPKDESTDDLPQLPLSQSAEAQDSEPDVINLTNDNSKDGREETDDEHSDNPNVDQLETSHAGNEDIALEGFTLVQNKTAKSTRRQKKLNATKSSSKSSRPKSSKEIVDTATSTETSTPINERSVIKPLVFNVSGQPNAWKTNALHQRLGLSSTHHHNNAVDLPSSTITASEKTDLDASTLTDDSILDEQPPRSLEVHIDTTASLSSLSASQPSFSSAESRSTTIGLFSVPKQTLYAKKLTACPVNLKPQSILNNNFLSQLLEHICNIFQYTPLEGYLFGSANYKKYPSDFDIVIENISSPIAQAHLNALIEQFRYLGAVVLAQDLHGRFYGYKKNNRHVIPIQWLGWNIDFIITETSFIEHARKIDFTIGASYYNLRSQKMFFPHPFSTPKDIRIKRIRTIIHPKISFTEDPSRLFRAVRLMSAEGFYLSDECINAIHELATSKDNVFASMKHNALYKELNKLFSSGFKDENLYTFYSIGLFFKLYDCVVQIQKPPSAEYCKQLQPYFNYLHQQDYQLPLTQGITMADGVSLNVI